MSSGRMVTVRKVDHREGALAQVENDRVRILKNPTRELTELRAVSPKESRQQNQGRKTEQNRKPGFLHYPSLALRWRGLKRRFGERG
jgi:hypothetical protein